MSTSSVGLTSSASLSVYNETVAPPTNTTLSPSSSKAL